MTSRQEANGTWTSQFRYEDAYGRSRSKCKRGFATEVDADRFERHFKARESKSLDISFLDFIELYEDDVAPQLKENTWRTKEYIINDKLVPFFGPMIMTEVTTLDAVRWQNALLKGNPRTGRPYTDTYLRTVNNQAVSIFNHAERFYKLKPNPFKRAPRIGSKIATDMSIWTKEDFLRFSSTLTGRPLYFMAFELLYWAGIRVGELLALVPDDFDLRRSELRITKSYQRINRRDVITDPKTENSVRTISLPEFLRDEVTQGLQGHFRRVWQLCPARCRQAYAAAAPAGRPGHAGAPALYGTGCSAVPCAIPEADHLRSDPDARFDPGRGACHHGGRHPLRHYHPRRRR